MEVARDRALKPDENLFCYYLFGHVEMEVARDRALKQFDRTHPVSPIPVVEMEVARDRALMKKLRLAAGMAVETKLICLG